MTDSHQQSYYELALTNRQVMVAFVVLLVCIFVAFFSGIWIGRQEDSQQVLEASQQTVEAAADALDLGTLQFFSDSKDDSKDGSKKEPLKAQNAGTTLAEDVGGTKVKKEAASEPPAAAQPRQTKPEPVAVAPPPATRVAEAETPKAQTTPDAQAAPTGDVSVIQVFSTADETQARNLKERLLKADFAAFISPVAVGGRTLHRVRIGPFSERSEATSVADKVRREFKLDTWITSP